MLAGSNDVLAKFLQVEVDTLNGVLKVLLFVVPVIVGIVTWWICRDLRARGEAPIARPGRVEFRRNAGGRLRRGSRRRGGAMTAAVAGAAPRRCWPSRPRRARRRSACRGAAPNRARDIFDLWQIFFWAGIAVAAIVYGLHRVVAGALPAAAARRRRRAGAALPRQRAARDRVHGDPRGDRDRAVRAVVRHRGSRVVGLTAHPTSRFGPRPSRGGGDSATPATASRS